MKTEIGGKSIEFGVSERTGKFSAYWNDQEYQANTLDALRAAIARDMKRKPLSIPVVRIQSDYRGKAEVTRGTVTGVHFGNKNIMIRWGAGKTSVQFKRWHGEQLFKATVDLVRHAKLLKAVKDAQAALDDFREKNSFNMAAVLEGSEE